MSTSSSGSKPTTGWQPPSLEEMQAMLPQYQFEKLLGRGGMGAVYKAQQVSLDRPVAIKVLPSDLIDNADANFLERFKNEARTMARLNHPSIVNVYDFGETQAGLLYFVMEFIDGTDVLQMIASQGRLPEEYALSITAHVCDALAYAHKNGVIHRDIKPANILINMEGAVKVADFGLAKANDPGQSGITKTNMAMGTPDFVAPEAFVPGVPLDGRADLYAIGVMLYQMLTGEIPRGIWTMPGMKVGTDPRFDAIIGKAMQTDREVRYQTAADLRRDLDTILTLPRAVLIARQQAAAEAAAKATRTQTQNEVAKDGHADVPPKKKSSSLGPVLGIAASVALVAGLYVMLTSGGSKKPPPNDSAASPSRPSAPTPAASTPPPSITPPAPVVAATSPAPAPEMPASPPAVPPADFGPGAVHTFGGHRYQLIEEKLRWDAAKARAESLGGHLATITSKEENEWLKNSLGLLKGTRSHVFLGGSRSVDDGRWTWVTGEPFDLSFWLGDVPDTHDPYLAFYLDQSRWDDIPDANSYSFLVEWDDAGTKPMPVASTAPAMPAAAPAVTASVSPPPPQHPALSQADIERIISFRGHRYRLLQGIFQWKQAEARARELGAHLASITSREENDFIMQSYAEYFRVPDNARGILIGLWQDKKDAPWTWITGESLEYAVWRPGEPNRISGAYPAADSAPCISLIYGGGWDDVDVSFTCATILIEWDSDPREDPRIAQLEKGFQGRLETDAGQPFRAALAKLNRGYITVGIARARAAAQARGSLFDVTMLDAEKALVEKDGAVPAEDAAETPASLKTLRATYRGALSKITAERDAKAAPLYDLYLKAIDARVAELTKAGKTGAAVSIQALRDEIATQKPAAAAAVTATSATPRTALAPTPKAPPGGGSSWRAAAEYLVNNGGTFTAFKNGVTTPAISKPEDIPSGRFDIIELTFDRFNSVLPPAKDADFAAFNGLRDLIRVHIRPMQSSLTDAAFAFLAGSSELANLNLEGVGGLTDGVLAHVAGLRKLDYLAIQHAENFTGHGLDKIAGVNSITNLELLGSGITDEGMKTVGAFKKIQTLRVTSPKVTSAGFATLAGLKSLVSLNVSGAGFDDEAAGIVAGISGLANLDLGATKITDAGLHKLRPLKKLTSLNLAGTAVTAEAAAEFQKLMPQCRVSR
ncbi:MAG: protein kinase [Verrucomicrobiaceae bacterium]|nr:protein kinase [Verrucomicrobiaceae bacterium]